MLGSLWTESRQRELYRALGYRTGHTPDCPQRGTAWREACCPVRKEMETFLFDWDHRHFVVACPARSSKSYTAAHKALPVILGREPRPGDPKGRPKPTMTWIVGPTYELAQKEFRYLVDLLVDVGPRVFPEWWKKPPLVRDSRMGGDLFVHTDWGCSVMGKSADKPQSLLGEAVDCVIVAEAAQFNADDVWMRYLEPRLSTTQGFAIFPTTPSPGALWLYELWVKGLEGTSNRVTSYTWPVTGNPAYPYSEFQEAEAYYGRAHPHFREQYLGEWVFYTGTVFGGSFDPARNLIDPYPLSPETRRIRAIDFGYRDPFVCKWYALTADGGLDCYREYYQAGRDLYEHAQTIRDLTKDEPIYYTVADRSEPQQIADLRRYGVPCLESNSDRREGRILMGEYLRTGRLRYIRGACPETIRELSHYRWDKDANKEGAKEKTLGDDHAMDTDRYAVMSRPMPRKTVVPIPKNSFADELRRRRQERMRELWHAGVA